MEFKFGILERVYIPRKKNGIRKIGVIRGRAEYQGYSSFSYMVQLPEEGEMEAIAQEDNLDFTKCTWFSENEIEKV